MSEENGWTGPAAGTWTGDESETVDEATPNREAVAESDTTADQRRLTERLAAVERAVTGVDRPVADLADAAGGASAAEERETLAERLDDVEARVEELEAATQAVRGYAGAIRAVNREVERRADLALARATEARDQSQSRRRDLTESGEQGYENAADGSLEGSSDAASTDAVIEAAIPGDDPATEREPHDTEPSTSDTDDDRGPLDRLRDAL